MIKYKVIKLTGLGMCFSCELARFDPRALYKQTPVIPALGGKRQKAQETKRI